MGLWPNVQAWYPDGRAATARELKKYENKSAIRKPDGSLRLGGGDAHAMTISTSQTPHGRTRSKPSIKSGTTLCNGTKGFDGDDHEIIEGAYDTLHGFVRGSDLYGWR